MRKACWSFSFSEMGWLVGLGLGPESESESESFVLRREWGWLEGRMEYSPVSQISRLPVAWEADSMRWFCTSILTPDFTRIDPVWHASIHRHRTSVTYPKIMHPRLHRHPSHPHRIRIPRHPERDREADRTRLRELQS